MLSPASFSENPTVLLVCAFLIISCSLLSNWHLSGERLYHALARSHQQTCTPETRVFLTTTSGCDVADFVYASHECCDQPNSKHLGRYDRVHWTDPNVIIFVQFADLPSFIQFILPNIAVPFVLLTGQTSLVKQTFLLAPDRVDVTGLRPESVAALLQTPSLIHWYTTNPWFRHPLVSGWPYGLDVASIPDYGKAYANATSFRKTVGVYYGALGTGHRPSRIGLPQGQVSFRETYYARMASYTHVLSPNGDRPDCYRHYEALGLGTIPITELDPYLFAFLNTSGVLFARDVHVQQHPTAGVADRTVVLQETWQRRLRAAIGSGEYALEKH